MTRLLTNDDSLDYDILFRANTGQMQASVASLTLSGHVELMRFVLITAIMALLTTDSFAAPWDIVPTAEEESERITPAMPVQLQRGTGIGSLQTLPELDITLSATGLGEISALALSEDGTIYSADKKTGRIWALSDRGLDGKIDLRRPLPHTFLQPTGLAAIGDTLYVADQHAVWSIMPGQPPKKIASLRESDSSGQPYVLRAMHNSPSLILGLTTHTQTSRVLKIDIPTGRASLITESSKGPLNSVAVNGSTNIWAGHGETLGALGSDPTRFASGQSVADILLPGRHKFPVNWPAQLREHIIASQVGPNAMHLIAIPTEFGQISGQPRVLLDGFMNRSQRSAWGKPGAMVMDQRGLFLANSHNGTLLRLSPKPEPEPKITIVDTETLSLPPLEEPVLSPKNESLGLRSTIQGTQINAASTILKPSSIEYGSKLIKDYDEKKALEKAEKAKIETKKKR
ncbi:NHL repeat-containing protein [Hellea balneolensis]|uniref:hypothetical protein n=1 Tax=Hellea balneolensis TaxID=287478 RepID=UPI000411DF1D|nr:hypothetical protein [Hellea balneolensis]